MTRRGTSKPKTRSTRAAALTLGPVLYNWPARAWRDFYCRIADEAPIDTVVIGEVACSKRESFFAPVLPKVVERLSRAGKEVVFATLALPTNGRELKAIKDLTADRETTIEANDVSALSLLGGRPHDVGLHVNVYNEGTAAWLAGRGARRICLPIELSRDQIDAMASAVKRPDYEVLAFGRAPLALSARCYAARAAGLHKDGCQFVCAAAGDGTDLETVDGTPFLAINGTTTMSSHWLNLAPHVRELRRMGVHRFRLSPQAIDMVRVARVFRGLLDGDDPRATVEELGKIAGRAAFSDGFYRGLPGATALAAA